MLNPFDNFFTGMFYVNCFDVCDLLRIHRNDDTVLTGIAEDGICVEKSDIAKQTHTITKGAWYWW